MLTKKRFMKLLIFLTIVSMLIVACDRPLPSNNNNETTQTNSNDNAYPAPTESTAVGGNTATDPNGGAGEVSEVEVPAEPTSGAPSESNEPEESGEPSEAEVPAEATGTPEAGSEESQEPSEAEVPAEGGEAEVPAEGGESEVPAEGSEAEVPAEATEVEVPAEATEVEVPAEASGEAGSGEVGAVPGQSIPATHTVAAGENLYRIGLQYGISWVAIAQANGITNPDRIYTGQVLDLPGSGQSGSGGQPEPMPTPEGINYVVKPGDTLFKIAQQFHISWVEIAEANGLVNPNVIYAGQMIKIPVDAPAPMPVIEHVVQPGETLFRISLQYGVSWLAIANANKIGPPYIIYAGETLIIPGGN